MDGVRRWALGVASLRIAYGVALAAAPTRVTRTWLGPGAAADPAQVALRGIGAREIALHAGVAAAALRGRPLRPWLCASIAGDLADIASTVAQRRGLPSASPAATAAVAGGSAALTAAVLRAADA